MPELTPIQRRLLAASDAIVEGQPDEVLFLHSVMAQTYFPTKQQPIAVRRWERRQGRAHLLVEAGSAWHPGRQAFLELPLPYGPKARLILMHLNSEAVRHRSHVIEVDSSMTAFVERIQGRHTNSRDITMFKAQLSALAAASITMALDRPESAVQLQTRIVGAFDLWFEKNASQRVLWPATVALSLDYFDTLSRHAVPLDERAVAALAKSATALDAYCWLAQRLHRIPGGKPQFVPWPALYEQFGQGYSQLRQFRAFFLRILHQVHAAYPAAHFEADGKGMHLWNSPPPLLKRMVTVHAIGDADTP
jgi:hypothetical protein